jgi:diguanylate cyclase (GGDEF)-like protein
MRAAVEVLGIPHPGLVPPAVVTVSGGVACYAPDDTVATLLSRADAALYHAKEAGRNRVVHAPVGSRST